jgi:hypothetical protein
MPLRVRFSFGISFMVISLSSFTSRLGRAAMAGSIPETRAEGFEMRLIYR